MATLPGAWHAALVNDDGSNEVGTVINKAQLATFIAEIESVLDALDNAGALSFTAATELTIAAGVITITAGNNVFSVDTEADAATDDLDTVTLDATTGRVGRFLVLKPENVARVVTIKHGTGNIQLQGGDFVMSAANHRITLYRDGSTWFELSRNTGGTGVNDAEYLVAAAHASLTAERVATNTDTVEWDMATAAQAKARGAHKVNAQTGTTYTYLLGDRGKLVTHSNASAIAGTLPQATGDFGSGWYMFVQNRGAGALTITPTTSTIDGAASLVLSQNEGTIVVSDGTNYFTMRGKAAAGAGGAPTDADYLVGSTHAGLSAERVVTMSDNIAWDIATAGIAKAYLSLSSEARGDILFRDATKWMRLAASTAGFLLQTNGAGADPSWAEILKGFNQVQVIDKDGSETVTSSTTLQDDNHITWSMNANKVHWFIGIFFCFGATGGDLKIGFKMSAAAGGGSFGLFGPQIGTTDASNTSINCKSVAINTTPDSGAVGMDGTNEIPIIVLGRIAAGVNAQTINMQWAQNTSNGTGTEIRGGFVALFKQI